MSTSPSPLTPRRRRSRTRSLWRAITTTVSLIGLLVVIVTFTPLVSWWAHRLSGGFDDPRGRVLIVLGAADTQDGLLSYSSYLRAAYAVRAYREGWVQVLVLSGSAESMADFAASQGVPRDIMRIDDSPSTHASGVNVTRLLADTPGEKVLLTSDFHMYRAKRVFERAGMHVAARPFPDAVKRSTHWQGRWGAFLDVGIETVKITYYRLRGWI